MRPMFALALAIGFCLSQIYAQTQANTEQNLKLRGGRLTTAERKAAAKRAAALGQLPGVAGAQSNAVSTTSSKSSNLMSAAASAGLASTQAAAPLSGPEGPGGVPHYFGPYGNWAFSPLPKGSIGSITVDNGGSGYSNNPTVTITDAYGTGSASGLTIGTATVTNGVIMAIPASGGSGYTAPVVTITDSTGTGAIATAVLSIPPYVTGQPNGIRKFVDKMPGLGSSQANGVIQTQTHSEGQYIPVAVAEQKTFSGQAADYYEIAVVEFTEKLHTDLPPTRLRGYVQIATPGNQGRNIPLVDINNQPINYPGTSNQVHVYDNPHYLGPLIIAQGRVHGVANTNPGDPGYPKPVRIKFWNLLPTGSAGNLFIPVDETIPGAGIGPAGPGTYTSKYTQNRTTIHNHGNNTVWISDGNVHQWITPGTENTPYPKGVSVRNVPDMLDGSNNVECDAANSGCMTFFYTNAQSARLMFYHDHALGITRLNVYSGQAAGYLITDAVDQDMINGTNKTGVNLPVVPGTTPDVNVPGNYLKVLPDTGIPLIIQDKTFVQADTIFAQDPTWNWGTGTRVNGNLGGATPAVTGDLWYPHVYMTVQNPWDLTGTNGMGRWHYGPWFNPPVPECVNGGPVGCIEAGPVPNEYYQPVCDGLPDAVNQTCTAPWEPPLRPGSPNPSMPGESFFDTPMVNGTAYPYLEVEPKPYRFRILNASNDRFVNLQLYIAADKNSVTTPDGYDPATARTNGCAYNAANNPCTEVNMAPVSVAPANQYADTPSGIPDPRFKGPDWIQIGTEGGFKPKPVVIPSQPIGYNLDPAFFNFGNVNQHSLFLGAAERADVVVNFAGYAGKTLILYNDSPAPVPAGAAPYDFYTGNGNQMDGGGAPNTYPGYGPNTRTIMQIRVAAQIANGSPDNAQVTLTNLNAVFQKTASKRGVFEVSQDPIIIPQSVYNSAYNGNFTATADQYIKIADSSKTFQPIDQTGALQPAITMPLELKAMHDEMGGVYDTMFGRMSGMLGLSLLNSPNHVLVPYNLASPPTDLVKGSSEATPVGVLPDGTQIWRIFHNGVDTHPIHVHLFNAQLINRVGQDGQGTVVDPIDLGWKETFRINPLEVTYLAMRPTVPTQSQVPFEVPDSVRLIDPTMPEGATLIPPPPAGWFDPQGNAITEISNHYVNFGWEYVWHCHILSHEEMDMMHSLDMVVPPMAPTNLSAATVAGPRVNLNWMDNSNKEASYLIERATDAAFLTGLTSFTIPGTSAAGAATYQDTTVANNTAYWYRVYAMGNTVGDTQVYAGSTNGFPTMSANAVSNTATIQIGTPTVPATPTSLTATIQVGPQVTLAWVDQASNETGFIIQRCTGSGCVNFANLATLPNASPGTGGSVSYVDTTVAFNTTYRYRVYASNSSVLSASAASTGDVVIPMSLSAPTSLNVTLTPVDPNYRATLTWTWTGPNPTNFTIQRATNSSFTTGLTSFSIAPAARTNNQIVSPNTTYYFRIRANNAAGSSPWANAVPFPIRAGSLVPTNFSVALTPLAPNYRATLTWTWTDPNPTNFTIQRATNSSFTTGLTSFSIAPAARTNNQIVSPNTTYYYRIRANYAAGSSAWVNASPFPITTGPSVPTNLSVALTSVTPNYRATLTWTWTDPNPTNFTIQRATNSSFTTGLTSFSIAPAARTNNQIVSPNTTYYFRIRANNAAGSSDWANASQFPITTGP
jgi:FtsP/CotA-like multicopper oxidase with cupredoxin domain